MRMRRFRDLPLFWKLLVPFFVLLLVIGVAGAFFIVRDLSSRAETALDQDLVRGALDARSALRDRELYVVESVNFASNLRGVSEAVDRGDAREVQRLVRSVLALKSDLDVLAITDASRSSIVERSGTTESSTRTDWSKYPFVAEALAQGSGAKSSGLFRWRGRAMLGVAGPLCSGTRSCDPVGTAIAGFDLKRFASDAKVTLFDARGRALTPGLAAEAPPAATSSAGIPRRRHRVGDAEIATAYAPMRVQNREIGTIAVSLPVEPAFASVRGAGFRLALILLAAMAGVVGVGTVISRFVLAQVRPLLATNRALGRGDLGARAPVMADDELGELARGVNQMAEQLQASHETLESKVAQRTEEIQRLLKERSEFFAGLSHEFRTPLAVILSQSEMMLDPAYGPAKRIEERSQATHDAAKQLLGLINEILDLAKAEAGRVEVELETLAFPDVVRELRPTIDGLAQASALEMSINVPKDLPLIRADRVRLREILLNLVHNAVKYTPTGGRVMLSAGSHNGHVSVTVSDTGVGIPPETGERVFEPFYRVKGTTSQHGEASSGLGLALAKRYVEAQGGTIEFASGPRGGATFTFTVPRAPAGPKAV
jgi:signal transduction histidine kinase